MKTLSIDIRRLVESFRPEMDRVQQLFAIVDEKDQMDNALLSTLKYVTKVKGKKALVFFDSIELLIDLHYTLDKNDMNHTVLHGILPKIEREKNLTAFTSGEKNICLASDIASQGLKIANISVVQFHFPRNGVLNLSIYLTINNDGSRAEKSRECYINRLGRAGANAKGKCYTLCTGAPEFNLIKLLENNSQFASPQFYKWEGLDVPEQANAILNFPEWARGNEG